MAASTPLPTPELQEKTATEPGWKVILWDDPVNTIDYVIHVLRKVFGYEREKATYHTMQVHEEGLSVVWKGGREQAELFVDQLHQHHLTATLESDA